MPRNFTKNFYGPKGTQWALVAPGGAPRGAQPTTARALVSCGLCGPPFAVIPTPKNHIYSKNNLRQFLSRLDSV